MMKAKSFREFTVFIYVLIWTATAQAQSLDKKLVGTVTGVLQGEKMTQVFVADRDNAPNTILVSDATQIKRQIDLSDIKVDEFAGVIFEEEDSKKIALSTTVGMKEKVELSKEELLKFAPQPEVPVAPEIPQAPEMPPLPEGAQPPGAGTPQGAPGEQGVDKKKEGTGFSSEEAAQAKGKGKEKKNPLEDILSEESPLSRAGGGPPPSFVSGKILSVDLQGENPTMTLQDAEGKEVSLVMGPQPQITNRYLDVASLTKGDEVEILYQAKEKDKIAKSILIARSPAKATE